jgi:hypothetical protein
MSNGQIAQAILEQLGGGQFVLMTGAKHLTAIESGLMFSLPARFARDGINKIRVTLDPSDTYTLEAFRMRGIDYTRVHTIHDLYAEDLRRTFTKITGLDCTMGQIRRAS